MDLELKDFTKWLEFLGRKECSGVMFGSSPKSQKYLLGVTESDIGVIFVYIIAFSNSIVTSFCLLVVFIVAVGILKLGYAPFHGCTFVSALIYQLAEFGQMYRTYLKTKVCYVTLHPALCPWIHHDTGHVECQTWLRLRCGSILLPFFPLLGPVVFSLARIRQFGDYLLVQSSPWSETCET